MPPLAGVARQPYFRECDGELVTSPGYDKASQRFGVFDSRLFAIPEPTLDAARGALGMLEDAGFTPIVCHAQGKGDRAMEEMIRRLEAGEDPEKVEEEMGDAIEEEMGEEGGGFGGGAPTRDDGIYPM